MKKMIKHSPQEKPQDGRWLLILHPYPYQPYSIQRFTGNGYKEYLHKEKIKGYVYLDEI